MGVPRERPNAYSAAGVDYSVLDAGKRLALALALDTSALAARRGAHPLDASRGESAFVLEVGGVQLALVVEGLGTKSIIAREAQEKLGPSVFAAVAYDTVAAIVNDLCSVGALPVVVNAYFATGASDWYDDQERVRALFDGWRRGCEDAGCAWGGGESPSLPGLLSAADIELAGSALGVIPQGSAPILGAGIAPGDEIVLVTSSGLHANGSTLARAVAGQLSNGYATRLPGSGMTFAEALLEPSHMYVALVAQLLERGVAVTYLSHITGHGLLKIMRPRGELTYRITALPAVPEVLELIVREADMDAHAAYSTLNMGCGYAVYCRPGSGTEVMRAAETLGLGAILAGGVEEGPRQVIVEPLDIAFAGEEMALSPDA